MTRRPPRDRTISRECSVRPYAAPTTSSPTRALSSRRKGSHDGAGVARSGPASEPSGSTAASPSAACNSDGSIEEGTYRSGRWFLREDDNAHDASGEVIYHDGDKPAEGPDWREREEAREPRSRARSGPC